MTGYRGVPTSRFDRGCRRFTVGVVGTSREFASLIRLVRSRLQVSVVRLLAGDPVPPV